MPKDDDLIDVHVGADEEKSTQKKRRQEHRPPDEPGVPRHLVPESPDVPVTVAPDENALGADDDDGRRGEDDGEIEHDLGNADTLRNSGRDDIEGGGRLHSDSRSDLEETNAPRRH